MKVKGNVLECQAPVITDVQVADIQDGLVGFVLGVRIHIYLSAFTIWVTLYFIISM